MRVSTSGWRPEALDVPMHLSIVGPDAGPLPSDDVQRLFAVSAISEARHDRLARCARIVATCGDRVIGLATYVKMDAELRVPDLAIERHPPCRVRDVLGAILDGLELACLAGGGQRILMRPPAGIPSQVFRLWGYAAVPKRRMPGWLEKRVP